MVDVGHIRPRGSPVQTGPIVEIFTDRGHIGGAKSFLCPELSPYGARAPAPPGIGAGKAPPLSLKPPDVVQTRAKHVAPAMGVAAVGSKGPRDGTGAHIGKLDQRIGL